MTKLSSTVSAVNESFEKNSRLLDANGHSCSNQRLEAKHMSKFIRSTVGSILFVTTVFCSPAAHALIEGRFTFGMHPVAPTDLNNTINNSNVKIDFLSGFGLDFLVHLPVFPLGFGIRYELLGDKAGDSAAEANMRLQRVSALGVFRLIDTGLYFGGIGSIGVMHDLRVSYPDGSNEAVAKQVTSLTAGAEGGVHLDVWRVGGEVGYQYLVGNSVEKNGGSYTSKIDLSGLYAKIQFGFHF
jgi:hypothetical protein